MRCVLRLSLAHVHSTLFIGLHTVVNKLYCITYQVVFHSSLVMVTFYEKKIWFGPVIPLLSFEVIFTFISLTRHNCHEWYCFHNYVPFKYLVDGLHFTECSLSDASISARPCTSHVPSSCSICSSKLF